MGRELRDRLKKVDPELHIVPGGTHRRPKVTAVDWDKAEGLICQTCGRETLIAIDGDCPTCRQSKIAEGERDKEDKAMKRYYQKQAREGTLDRKAMWEGRLGNQA